ncbi:MAG: hypothetical protein ACOYJ2_09370 [Rickettsiales bacterium]
MPEINLARAVLNGRRAFIEVANRAEAFVDQPWVKALEQAHPIVGKITDFVRISDKAARVDLHGTLDTGGAALCGVAAGTTGGVVGYGVLSVMGGGGVALTPVTGGGSLAATAASPFVAAAGATQTFITVNESCNIAREAMSKNPQLRGLIDSWQQEVDRAGVALANDLRKQAAAQGGSTHRSLR